MVFLRIEEGKIVEAWSLEFVSQSNIPREETIWVELPYYQWNTKRTKMSSLCVYVAWLDQIVKVCIVGAKEYSSSEILANIDRGERV